MLRWLTARSGYLSAQRPLPTAACCAILHDIRPSLPRFYSSQPTPIRYKLPWAEWLCKYPTSVEEMQTVYKACAESHVFAPVTQGPFTLAGQTTSRASRASQHVRLGNIRDLERRFNSTLGLLPQDWKARGIEFQHALEIALQLHLSNTFATGIRNVEDLISKWHDFEREAEAAKKLERMEKTIMEGRAALMGGDTAKATAEKRKLEERQELNRALDMRRILRTRKQAELDSDAAEGIKSKRRPMRLAATSKGVPLAPEAAEKLRRLERHGREVIVDKEVKERIKRPNVDHKLVRQKRDDPMRKNANGNNMPPPDDGNFSSKEQRGSLGLAKVKKLAERPWKVLTAVIKTKENVLKNVTLSKAARRTAERSLSRAKQALALLEWEARNTQQREGGPGEKSR